MYKLLLCDDDQIVLEGLKNWLLEAHPEIELVGCATNGKLAEEMINQHKPHILITDICMPFVSGLQLIEYARNINPLLHSIIISGYNDFEYARKAVQLGAIDFLLKPINVEELDRLVTAAVTSCTKEENRQELAKQNVLRKILDASDISHTLSLCDQVSLPSNDYYQIVILENEKYITDDLKTLDEFRYGIYKQFNQLANQIATFGCIISRSYSNMIVCLNASGQTEVERLCQKIEKMVQSHNHADTQRYSITMAKGLCRQNITNVQDSYAQAVTAMQYKYILNKDILDFSSIHGQHLPDVLDDQLYTKQFTLNKLNSQEAIDRNIHDLKNELTTSKCTSNLYISMVISNIYIQISRDLNDYGIKMSDIFDQPFAEMQKVLLTPSFSGKLESLRSFLYQVQAYTTSYSQHKHTKMINDAVNYIHEHYMEPSLTLENAAQTIFMSPNYFSSVFKEQTGQTFSNYLMNYRIEKAKYLIEYTNHMFYEISTMVGYPNAPYFSSLFKKKTGYSPSDYKAQLNKEKYPD